MTGDRGYTLVEMLVALVVGALLAMAAHRGLHVLAELARRGEARLERAHNAAAVRRQLLSWIRGVPAADGWGLTGGEGAIPGSAYLEFRSRSAGPFRDEDARVRVEFEPESRSVVASATVGGAPLERIVLVRGAEGVEIRYRYDAGGVPRWTSEWTSTATLPLAVEIRIAGDSVAPLLRLPIVATVGGAI